MPRRIVSGHCGFPLHVPRRDHLTIEHRLYDASVDLIIRRYQVGRLYWSVYEGLGDGDHQRTAA